MEVIEYLAEHLTKLRRGKMAIGLCMKEDCVMQHKSHPKYKPGSSMIQPNSGAQPCKCFRCKSVVAPFEESWICTYCSETYCSPCMGHAKFYDMAELEALIMNR
jgi:hypothetical protein